ncbi:MAG: ATP-NAD kinase family protein [Methanobacteriota archaeon]
MKKKMNLKIGFLVNPIAGMGGKVGLKGTDGVLNKAISLGATPIAPHKAEETLNTFKTLISTEPHIQWITCAGPMGAEELHKANITNYQIVYEPRTLTTDATDTKNACRQLIKNNIDLLMFCGGDGTARDIFEIINKRIPLLGIPSGVKMHSGVFAINTTAAAKMLNEYINQRLTLGDADIMDLDEDRYRKGEWKIRLIGVAKGIIEPTYIQVGKTIYESISEDTIKDELAEHINDEMEKHTDHLFLLGSGGTLEYIAQKLDLKKTLLGIDAVYQKKLIGTDLNEQQLLILLKKYPKVTLILSPIGAQGFILGRGNLQLSPQVIKKIGIENILIVATPAKLVDTPFLRVDTGDRQLDKEFSDKEFFMVLIGYRLSRVVKIRTNNF